MTCESDVAWDLVGSATTHSVLAGVLAGFLIAAAAVLFASPARYAPYTIALFAAAVPGLALSSYIFITISAAKPKDSDHQTCAQLWSQGTIASAMLLIGSAVLLSGLGWVLVTYSEDFAIKLRREMTKNLKAEGEKLTDSTFDTAVEKRRVLLVTLGACLSGGAIVATSAFLIIANVRYLQELKYDPLYAFLVLEIGVYVVVRSVFVIVRRTGDALDTIRGAEPRPQQDISARWASEILIFAIVCTATVFVTWIADLDWRVISLIVLGYVIGRVSFVLQRNDPTVDQRSADERSVKFTIGKLPQTIYSVALWPIVTSLFVALLALQPIPSALRTFFTLGMAGFYPGVILLGLSYSVAAGKLDYVPKWLRGPVFWRFVP